MRMITFLLNEPEYIIPIVYYVLFIEQIQNQNYAKPYISDKRKVLKIGVNFDSESKELTEWIVEQ